MAARVSWPSAGLWTIIFITNCIFHGTAFKHCVQRCYFVQSVLRRYNQRYRWSKFKKGKWDTYVIVNSLTANIKKYLNFGMKGFQIMFKLQIRRLKYVVHKADCKAIKGVSHENIISFYLDSLIHFYWIGEVLVQGLAG